MMDLPPRTVQALAVGVVLIAVGGAATAVRGGLQDLHWEECSEHSRGPRAPPLEPEEPEANKSDDREEAGAGLDPAQRDACVKDRRLITATDAVARAALGPGIALVALAGVAILAAAIAVRPGR